MQHYLLQGSYTSEGWEALLKNPQNRFEAIRPSVEKLGGKIEHGWLAFVLPATHHSMHPARAWCSFLCTRAADIDIFFNDRISWIA